MERYKSVFGGQTNFSESTGKSKLESIKEMLIKTRRSLREGKSDKPAIMIVQAVQDAVKTAMENGTLLTDPVIGVAINLVNEIQKLEDSGKKPETGILGESYDMEPINDIDNIYNDDFQDTIDGVPSIEEPILDDEFSDNSFDEPIYDDEPVESIGFDEPIEDYNTGYTDVLDEPIEDYNTGYTDVSDEPIDDTEELYNPEMDEPSYIDDLNSEPTLDEPIDEFGSEEDEFNTPEFQEPVFENYKLKF